MKTIKEWAETMNEPYRSKITFNSDYDIITKQAEDLYTAILLMMYYSENDSDATFWSNYLDSEFFKPIVFKNAL